MMRVPEIGRKGNRQLEGNPQIQTSLEGSCQEDHRQNMKRFNKRQRGFTLVEIMIVVLIIGILMAIAVPNFVKARTSSRTQTCIANLKQIDSAKEQWAMDNKKDTGAAVTDTDLFGATAYVKSKPAEPGGGTYTLNAVGTNPACSNVAGGHVLP